MEGQPTEEHPCPTIDIAGLHQPAEKTPGKSRPKNKDSERTIQQCTKYSPAEKKAKIEEEQTDIHGDISGEDVDNSNYIVYHDHNYICVCDCRRRKRFLNYR